MPGWNIGKLGSLLSSMKPGKKREVLQKAISIGLQWQRMVNDRYYEVTMGALLRKLNSEAITLLRKRNRKQEITDERLNGRLEILDEIEKYITTKIQTGQEAQAVLAKQEEESNARTKRAS